MATSVEMLRDELFDFFDKEIAPIIIKENHDADMRKHLITKLAGKFSAKYKFIVKRYGATIRVSANYGPLGIIFFMAATRDGHESHKFKDPCYWAKSQKKAN